MEYRGIKKLVKFGNSYCLVIPAEWIKENKLHDYSNQVTMTIRGGFINIVANKLEPTKSQ